MEELSNDIAPSFTLHLRPRVVQARDTCKLLCSLTGKPTPTVKWYKDRRELSKYDYSITFRDGVATLKISDCKPEDSGKYTCIATNELGSVETNCVLTVEGKTTFAKKMTTSDDIRTEKPNKPAPVIEKPYKPSPTQEKPVSATPASPVAKPTVKVEPLSTTPAPSQPRAKSPVQSSRKVVSSISTLLMTKPSFVRTLPDEDIVKEGTPLLLSCSVRGDPEPEILWYKDEEKLYTTDYLSLKYRHGVASLAIEEVLPEDEGVYTVKAVNVQGEVESKCNVTVITLAVPDQPPRIVEHAQSQIVARGNPVTLVCRVAEAEHYDVVWSHNNEKVKPSEEFQYSSVEDVHKLHIARISPKDAGNYTCEAFNREGKSCSSCTLVVSVPGEFCLTPEYVDFPSSATLPVGTQAVFFAELKKTPLELQWIKDGKAINVKSDRYKLRMDGTARYRFEIVSCGSHDSGLYEARAVGSKGDSFAAFYLNVFKE